MILVAGSANLDFVVRAQHIPTPGETVLGREFKTYPGGKGANQAVACARAGGARTRMLMSVGDDDFAKPIEESLKDAGVELLTIRTQGSATGTAFICVSDDAENAITVAPGANALLAPAHLPPLQGISYLLLQLETPLPTVLAFAQAARKQGVMVALNAAPAQDLPKELLDHVDILIVNEAELAVVAHGTGSIARSLQQLSVPYVVVTLGSRGSCARIGAKWLVQPAFAVQAVDTTGAGDTFCGTLVAALDSGQSWEQAMVCASAASALACTRAGAQASIPTQQEVTHYVQLFGTPDPAEVAQIRTYCAIPT